jgi:hypothetical protein
MIKPKKQQKSIPPASKPQQSPTSKAEQRELESALQTYNCNLGKLSQEVRRLGLEQKLTTCGMAERLIKEGIERYREQK